MTSLQEQKTVSRGSIPRSRFEIIQDFYFETRKGSSVFLTLFIALLLHYFLGVFILVDLSYHTPHVAHDNFKDEIFLWFYG